MRSNSTKKALLVSQGCCTMATNAVIVYVAVVAVAIRDCFAQGLSQGAT